MHQIYIALKNALHGRKRQQKRLIKGQFEQVSLKVCNESE